MTEYLREEWQNLRLGDLVEFKNGLNYSREAPGKGLKIIGVGDFQDRGTAEYESLQELSGFDKIADSYLLQEDDLVFVRSNGNKALIGRVLHIKNLTHRVTHSGFTIRARVVKPNVSASYLALITASPLFKEQMHKQGGGTNISNLSQSVLSGIELLLPPLPEQRRIVEILDEADAAVRTTDALIAAKLKLKRAWAERLLTGRVRFPEFAGEAWQTRHLGEFFRDRNARYKGEMPPLVLSCSKIYGIVPQTDLFSRVLASKDLGRYKFVEPGDLVFDPMLLWDASINFSSRTGVVSPAYSTLQFVAADAEPRFFHYLFDSHALRHIYKTISQGTNTRRKKATASDFLKIAVSLPALPEQRKIAEVLSLMDEEIGLRRRQLAALKAQKQGLMQRLLTGEVRTHPAASGDPPETGR